MLLQRPMRGGVRGTGDRSRQMPASSSGARDMKQSQRGRQPFSGAGNQPKRRWGAWDKPQKLRESSVEVGIEWRVLEDIEFSRLNKVTFEPAEPVDLFV